MDTNGLTLGKYFPRLIFVLNDDGMFHKKKKNILFEKFGKFFFFFYTQWIFKRHEKYFEK